MDNDLVLTRRNFMKGVGLSLIAPALTVLPRTELILSHKDVIDRIPLHTELVCQMIGEPSFMGNIKSLTMFSTEHRLFIDNKSLSAYEIETRYKDDGNYRNLAILVKGLVDPKMWDLFLEQKPFEINYMIPKYFSLTGKFWLTSFKVISEM